MGKFLEKVPQLIAALSLTVLLFSVTYEWGYFSVVGSQFQWFMSPVDYMAGALAWLPIVTVSFVGAGLTHIVPFRVAGWHVGSIPRPRTKQVLILVNILALAVAIVYFFFVTPHHNAPLIGTAVTIFWFEVCSWIYLHPSIRKVFPFWAASLVLTLPLLGALAFTVGMALGAVSLNNFDDVYHVVIKEKVDGHFLVLKNLVRGLIVLDVLDHKVKFYRWEDITTFELRSGVLDERTLSCRWFNVQCKEQPAVP